MGETFLDRWEDAVPEQFQDWTLLGVNNTKWEGNFYEYRHADEDHAFEKNPHGEFAKRICIQSVDPNKVRLNGRIVIRVGSVEIRIKSAGVYEDPFGQWLQGLEWSDFTQALTDLSQKADRLYEQATNLSQEVEELGKWEG